MHPRVVPSRVSLLSSRPFGPVAADADRHCRSLLAILDADCGLSRWITAEKSTRIPVSMFHAALLVAGNEDMSAEEAECLVANMIYKGFMRGYISHEKQMVVIAKTGAFPRLAERPAPLALF